MYGNTGEMSLRTDEGYHCALLTFMCKTSPNSPRKKTNLELFTFHFLVYPPYFDVGLTSATPTPEKKKKKNLYRQKKNPSFHKVLNRQRLSKQYPKGREIFTGILSAVNHTLLLSLSGFYNLPSM